MRTMTKVAALTAPSSPPRQLGGLLAALGPRASGDARRVLDSEGDTMFTYDLICSDYGTERLLTVRDGTGQVIGQCDPFAGGIPADLLRRELALGQAARQIVADYRARQAEGGAK